MFFLYYKCVAISLHAGVMQAFGMRKREGYGWVLSVMPVVGSVYIWFDGVMFYGQCRLN